MDKKKNSILLAMGVITIGAAASIVLTQKTFTKASALTKMSILLFKPFNSALYQSNRKTHTKLLGI